MNKFSRLKRLRCPMPEFIQWEFLDKKLIEAYQERSAYQQNGYSSWITPAKQEATKKKRLEERLSDIRGEKFYMKMMWKNN